MIDGPKLVRIKLTPKQYAKIIHPTVRCGNCGRIIHSPEHIPLYGEKYDDWKRCIYKCKKCNWEVDITIYCPYGTLILIPGRKRNEYIHISI